MLGIDFKNILFTGLLLTAGVVGCKKQSDSENTKVYTHAITGLFNPGGYFIDNTVEGLNYAMSFEGLQGIEMDVQFSADSSLWMFHDLELDGKTTGSGTICQRSDEFMSGLRYLESNESLTKLVDVDLSKVQGVKDVFIDVKYVGACSNIVPSANKLEQECVQFLDHPSLSVTFIINNSELAQEMKQLGYSIWSDADEPGDIDLNSTIYDGWFLRNKTISEEQIVEVQNGGKSVILYENYSPGAIHEALSKGPEAILVEDVKEAVLLSAE